MKRFIGLVIAGVIVCSSITACGNNTESAGEAPVAGIEKESISNAENVEETSSSAALSIPGTWQTASVGYGDDDNMQPEYYVQFTDTEIQYGHMADGAFSLDHSDKISSIEKTANGYKVQAENSNGVKYTFKTSEDDTTILEYYGSWDENEFAGTYSGSSSLLSCDSVESTDNSATGDDYSAYTDGESKYVVFTDASNEEVEAYAKKVVDSVLGRDWDTVGDMIQYPIGSEEDNNLCANKEEFVKYATNVGFQEEFFTSLSAWDLSDLWGNYLGACIDNGNIWFRDIDLDKTEFKIVALFDMQEGEVQ